MFEKIIDQIERFDSIVLFGHCYPDGDSFGSQIGLRELLRLRYPNKKVYAVGTGLPDFGMLIGTMDEVSDEVIANSLAIILDGNDLARMEDKRVYNAKAFAKIDHHLDLHSFTEGPEFINDQACSTCEIIMDFAHENKMEINKIAAKALYLGITTDSGRYQFSNNYYKMFDFCRELVSLGADPYATYQILNARAENHLSLIGYVYSNYKKTKGGTLYIVFDKKTISKFNEDAMSIANNVGLLGNVKGYGIWAFFVERENGKMSTEMRSNLYNVQQICSKYGGGGHLHASGLTVEKFDKKFIKQLLKDCDDTIAEGIK